MKYKEKTFFIISGLSHRTHVELPFYSKYLLIAAYLASYNPAKTDRKFFAKHSGKVNKRAQMSAASKKERVRPSSIIIIPHLYKELGAYRITLPILQSVPGNFTEKLPCMTTIKTTRWTDLTTTKWLIYCFA